jgi:hypothetical protein
MFTPKDLFEFVNRAAKATYSGGGKYEEVVERPGFFELVYREDPSWYYRDSYTGHSRSGGQEIVRFNDKPIWWSGYGGGMMTGKEQLANETFAFLKKALTADEVGFDSLRGPHSFVHGDWRYIYTQEGEITDFYGIEEIFYKKQKIFWHRAVGGILVGK